MAGNMTDYLENKLLEHTLGQTAFSMPTNVYLALFTADPTDAGTLTNELPNANNYARVDFTALMGTASSGAINNNTDVAFATATGDWGVVSHIAVMDSPTLGSGNMLYHSQLSYPVEILNTDDLVIASSNLIFTLD